MPIGQPPYLAPVTGPPQAPPVLSGSPRAVNDANRALSTAGDFWDHQVLQYTVPDANNLTFSQTFYFAVPIQRCRIDNFFQSALGVNLSGKAVPAISWPNQDSSLDWGPGDCDLIAPYGSGDWQFPATNTISVLWCPQNVPFATPFLLHIYGMSGTYRSLPT